MTALLTRELVTYPAREVKVHLLSGFLSLHEDFSTDLEEMGCLEKRLISCIFYRKDQSIPEPLPRVPR